MPSSGIGCRVALVRTDNYWERIAYIIRATRIGELGTTLAVSSNRSMHAEDGGATLLRNVGSYKSHKAYHPR
jgi:hypothetical protein